MGFTIHKALDWWAKTLPDAPAVRMDADSVSFLQLHEWSRRIGAYLRHEGVSINDRVAVIGPNSLDYCALALGIVQAGAIGAPCSVRLTARELEELLIELDPVVIFAHASCIEKVRVALANRSTCKILPLAAIGTLRDGSPAALQVDWATDHPVLIIPTSGSTGRPKGVVYSHRSLLMYACEFALMEPQCARGARALVVGPMSSASGYQLVLKFVSMGTTLYLQSHFEAASALKLLASERINCFEGVPIFFERIAALPAFDAATFPELHYAHVAGSRVPLQLMERWRKKGVVLRHAYGQTEACGAWAAPPRLAAVAPEKCGDGGVFTEFAVMQDGQRCPPGQPGEIVVRGPSSMLGYWRQPEQTARTLRDGWLHTGDLGMADEQGNVTVIDRIKDIIISGGLNISASEVERIVAEVDGVLEVAVIAASDADFGETPLAVVHGEAIVAVASIIEHCNRNLANYKVPRYVVLSPEPLPRLPSGKIAKPALRSQYRDAATRLRKVR